jgi:hypothetical protein
VGNISARKTHPEGFTVWLSRGFKFRYNAQRDGGSAKRYNEFFLDPKVPPE